MPGVVLKPSAARRPALKVTSPPALIEAHPKLNGSKLSSVLSASFVKLYSWASAGGACADRTATAAAQLNRPSLSLRATPPANEIVLTACLLGLDRSTKVLRAASRAGLARRALVTQ